MRKVDNRIPFLGFVVSKNDNRALTKTAYRKPTPAEYYMGFDSNYPDNIKLEMAMYVCVVLG